MVSEPISQLNMKKACLGSIHLALILITLLMSSCAPVGPDFIKPGAEVPQAWIQPEIASQLGSEPELSTWWQAFNDPVLDNLVKTARQQNNNLEIAGLRVLEARAQLGVVSGAIYPQSQLMAGEARYQSPPENTGVTNNYWNYALGATVAWEIDFWGKFRRGIESADAALLSSVAAYDQALVLLTAQVVDTYLSVRVIEEQLRISKENIRLQERSYQIAEVLYESGDTSELDMQQAHTLLMSTKSTVPGLKTQLNKARNALATLLGMLPGTIDVRLHGTGGVPLIPEDIVIGVPADMLRRRPDVRQAELLALAQNAQVGVAEAGLYPSFSLAGSIGLASGSPSDSSFGSLFGSDAVTYSIGPKFVWPFFNYGRITNTIRVQDARLQQALVKYRETVLQAATEAENAIAGLIGAKDQYALLAETVDSAKRSASLSTLRYTEGFSDYQRVLNSQQALFTQQQRLISTQEAGVKSLAALFKALGGGWEGRDGGSFVPSTTLETMKARTDWGKVIQYQIDGPTPQSSGKYSVDW